MSVVPTGTVKHFLDELHYLGATGRGFAWSDEFGVLVLAKPTARRLPQDGTWLELVRWCLLGEKNGGSRQWKVVSRWLRANRPEVTTVVSYSDGEAQSVKDRWVFALRPDGRRDELLRVKDGRA